MAGLDVAGSAIGIVSLGITVIQGLCKYYYSWKDASADVMRTLKSLEGFSRILERIQSTDQLSSKEVRDSHIRI